MPPRNRSTAQPSTALTPPAAPTPPTSVREQVGLDQETYRQLMQSQADQIQSAAKLPRVKVMPQGVGLFEFEDTQETIDTLEVVVLHSHPRNVLWDRPIGDAPAPESGEKNLPACASEDGENGKPREGFVHLQLARAAVVGDVIACAICPYNQFDTAHLIGKQGKGKACANQRSLYALIDGRETPVVLSLSATSMAAWDEYLTSLLTQRIPVQAVRTTITLERKQRGTLRWSQARFQRADVLNAAELGGVLHKRSEYALSIGLVDNVALAARDNAAMTEHVENGGLEEEAGDVPPF